MNPFGNTFYDQVVLFVVDTTKSGKSDFDTIQKFIKNYKEPELNCYKNRVNFRRLAMETLLAGELETWQREELEYKYSKFLKGQSKNRITDEKLFGCLELSNEF